MPPLQTIHLSVDFDIHLQLFNPLGFSFTIIYNDLHSKESKKLRIYYLGKKFDLLGDEEKNS